MKERAYWLDYLRITATFLVIMIHASSQYLYKTGAEFWAGNFYDSLARMSVPLFVMISGSLIIGKTDSYKIAFNKRIKKVLFPLLIWSLIYLIYRLIKVAVFEHVYDFTGTLKDILSLKQGLHLWFLYMLIGLYLLAPLLNKFFLNAKKRDQTVFLLICLGVFMYDFTIKVFGIELGFNFLNLSGFILYFISGYYLKKYFKSNSRRIMVSLIVLFLLGFSVTFFGTYVTMANNMGWPLYSYLSPNVLLMTFSSFLIFQMSKESFKNSPKNIMALSNASFGIYLVHPIVLQVLAYVFFIRVTISSWVKIPLHVLLAFIISFGIIWIIQRFKYSSYIVGV